MRHKRYIGLPLMHLGTCDVIEHCWQSRADSTPIRHIRQGTVFVYCHCRLIGCQWVDWFDVGCLSLSRSHFVALSLKEWLNCRFVVVGSNMSLSVIHFNGVGCWCRMSVVGDRWLSVSTVVHCCLLLLVACQLSLNNCVVGVILCWLVWTQESGRNNRSRTFRGGLNKTIFAAI